MVIEILAPKKKRTGTSISSNSSSDDEALPTPTPLHKLAPAKLYNELSAFKLTDDQLLDNGYPSWDHFHNHAYFELTGNNSRDWVNGNDLSRQCSRCRKGFLLNPNGTMNSDRCSYHHRPKCDPLTGKKRHTCCSAKPGPSSGGCITEQNHVFSSSWKDTLREFVRTPQPNGSTDFRSKKVYALDCELIHTLNGLEVARVSVIDIKGRVLLDTFVLPVYKVVSYNSKFSGVTAKNMETAISLEACRLQLFQFINSETLIVGHSLESDLKALRLVHFNCIDTSVLFSVPRGPFHRPVKLSLQILAWQHLRKIIQVEESGHSSVEDAGICLQLLAIKKYSNDLLFYK